MGSFAWQIAIGPALLGGLVVFGLTRSILLTAGTVLAACLYGYVWERVFGDPHEDEELEGVGLPSTAHQRDLADSVQVFAALGVLILIVAVVAQLVMGHYLWAAATVGAAGVAVLIVRALTKTSPPHRRRRRRQVDGPH